MRKFLTLSTFLPFLAFAQSLVSITPQQRTVLLEDFTGIHCGYCPEGHTIAASLKAAHPDELVVVGVHAGIYAVPSGTEPDFRTPEGNAFDAQFTITGYPVGVINRHLFDGEDDLGRGAWEGAVNELLVMPSNVNLGMSSSFDPGSRDLTVTVELYYTADSPDPEDDYISVFMMEDHIIGWQTDYTNGDHSDYDHTNVLRKYLTDVWGDPVTTTTTGTSVIRTYVYNVPTNINVANSQVAAFVSEYQREVYQVREVPADGGNTLVIGELENLGETHAGGISGTATAFNYDFDNLLGTPSSYEISLLDNGAPAGWNAAFTVDGTTYSGTTTTSLPNGTTTPITVSVTPDANPGIGSYTLQISSIDDPLSPVLQQNIHVISNVHDLIVTNPQAEPHLPLYNSALDYEPFLAATTRDEFVKFAEANALGGVLNYYFNVSWTFPSLTDELVGRLAPLMDAGANVMMAGQDIGWDQSGATGSYGTPATQAFYSSHLHAAYVADGSTATTQLTFVPEDEVFGGVGSSAINNVFGTNIYPDEITPLSPATSILYYNGNTSKIGGLRAQTGAYKLVYFGVGPEQMTNTEVGRSMISLSHDWFYGIVSVEDLDNSLMDLLGNAYPSPTNDLVTIPLMDIHEGATLRLLDATGREVLRQPVLVGTRQISLNVDHLGDGLYVYQLIGAAGGSASRTLQVIH